ncbi:ABC transporter permease [Paraliobacillus zengyii]|uniref:ABC transporter permease n=1 Tax=Paraliobacillus zengyii TaxID=2213194 RepID=UPI000E3E6D69|nr:ABC transporter permease [Paraliobacillus zengyii]
MVNQLTDQSGVLFRFLVKRERVKLPIWIMSILVTTLSVAVAFTGLYQSVQERQAMAETMRNPAMAALVGQGYGLDNYTDGAMMAHQMLLITAVVVAIMNILLVVRLTRADEEDGQLEMLRALPMGRLAQTYAVMILVVGTNVVMAFLAAVGLSVLGIDTINISGSLLYGAVLGTTGIFFAAVTMLVAQLSDNSRGAMMLAYTVLGVSYFIRAIGDAGNTTISWFSPLGLLMGAEVYVNNYWWPVLVTLIVSGLVIVMAFFLNQIRDIGSGFLPSQSGKMHASRFLQTPLGLAMRLQRTPIIAWTIGMFVIGASYGSVLGDLDTFFEENEVIKQMLSSGEEIPMTEQFLSMLMVIMAMIATVPAVMTLVKIKAEEKQQRTEHLLARAISKPRLLASYLIIAFLTSIVMLAVSVLGLASTGLAVLEIDISFTTLLQAMIVYLPALWVMLGVTTLLIGIGPRFSAFSWFYLLYAFFVVYLGGLLEFPKWLANLSPFAHIPQLPVEEINYYSLISLTVIAGVLILIGFIGYRKRDVQG